MKPKYIQFFCTISPMFTYEFIHSPSFKIDTSLVDSLFEIISKYILLPQNGILNIIFISEQEIQSLNFQYRKKDEVTDVLSFHYFEDFSKLKKDEIAGELVFCESKILSQ